jgi:glycosyltransferase involved in cell wall biosynthesis
MSSRPAVKALVYGDVNLNVIDGSAIWAPSTVETLARAGCLTTLLLKSRIQRTTLVEPLEGMANVRIARPYEDRLLNGKAAETLSIPQAIQVMGQLDAQEHFDIVLIRGFGLAGQIVDGHAFDGRLWTYLTDIPQSVATMDEASLDRLAEIAEASRFLLCQTEDLRSYLEESVPAACGRSVLFPPVVPAQDPPPAPRPIVPGQPLRLVYSGKFAPLWNTLEMMALPAKLAQRGVNAELHVIGDKVHRDPADPTYHDRMEAALHSPGVIWHGAQTRLAAMQICAESQVGLGWRDPELDASLELSTKVLEYGSVGLPVALNRTPMHEALLGQDYPLFVQDERDLVDQLSAVAGDPAIQAGAAARCQAAAAGYSFEVAAANVGRLVERAFPSSDALGEQPRPLRIVVASHDLKFFDRILGQLQGLPQVEVRVDHWNALTDHDRSAGKELVDWADVVICEWFGQNAVWYSQNRRKGQRLIVRLHRFELYSGWTRQANISRIDQVICVSPYYAELTLAKTGWPADKVAVIPNLVDDADFDRPKLEGARFHLGFIGVAPARKRMDLALDVLARLRRDDPRYMLFAKSKMPWDYDWIWGLDEERAHFDGILRRIQTEPELRGAVTFDRFGADVPAWLRRIGWVLSTSDDESFHLAPAEGMASRAVPVIRNWPGADTIYDSRWIQPDPEAMADRIAEANRSDQWAELGEVGHDQVRRTFALERVVEAWIELLRENRPAFEPGLRLSP